MYISLYGCYAVSPLQVPSIIFFNAIRESRYFSDALASVFLPFPSPHTRARTHTHTHAIESRPDRLYISLIVLYIEYQGPFFGVKRSGRGVDHCSLVTCLERCVMG